MQACVRHFTILMGATALLALALHSKGLMAQAQPAGAVDACGAIRNAALPDVRITAATTVAAQPAWSPGPGRPFAVARPFCRVEGVIEKEIGFEVWLPQASDWNGKLLGAGVGGDAGTFNYQDLPRAVARGYAAATTDSGHKASDTVWMLGDPQRLVNFELRAHHRLAEVAKALIERNYARPARYSYFIGCSGGGRQGLKEMQRFPGDYDGIIAGAPGPDTAEMTARRMWEINIRDANAGVMSREQWQFVADSAVQQCDAADGVKDGVAEDPRLCRFDPARLACVPGQSTQCLNPAQVKLAQAIYAPLRDEEGRTLDDGLLPGVVVDSGRSRLAPATFGQAIRRKADWDGKDFNLSRDLPAIGRVMPELRADDPNLAAFRARGGKAILYQGWLDPAVAARMTLAYFEAVQKAMGPAQAESFLRLYMVPGMLHCGGGSGTDRFGGGGADAPVVDARHDLLSALEDWVEHGRPPQAILASRVENGQVVRTRPLCPAPAMARYTGSGSTDEAANFRCVPPAARQ
jgi:feruloyl esterase